MGVENEYIDLTNFPEKWWLLSCPVDGNSAYVLTSTSHTQLFIALNIITI